MTPIEQSIESIVDGILLDYGNGRTIDRLDPFQQPDKEVVIDMIGKLIRIVYPGYSRDKSYRIYNARHNLSMLIEDVMYNLNKQIAIVLRPRLGEEEASRCAQEISIAFFRAIPDVRSVAQTDVEAFFEGDPAAYSSDEIIFCYPGLFAVTVYRLAHVLYTLEVPMLPRMMTEHAHSITGIDINPGATIGNYFFIDHGTGIVVGETTVIGENVKLYQGVTLGALSPRKGHASLPGKRHPTVGSDVTIYSGASILGGETTIGDHAVVGGNAFLTDSVAEDTQVVIRTPEPIYRERKHREK